MESLKIHGFRAMYAALGGSRISWWLKTLVKKIFFSILVDLA